MPALLKYTLLLTNLLCLSACLPLEEDNKKSSESTSLLPAVNHNLSSESPTGIWMLEITANRFESYYSAGFEENSSNHSSDFFSYKFLIINEYTDAEDTYAINDCPDSFRGIPQIVTHWQLANSILSNPETSIEEEDAGLFTLSSSSHAELKLVNNLKLSGTQKSSMNISALLFADIDDDFLTQDLLLWSDIVYSFIPKIHKKNLKIKGIKVSDKTNFAHAAELNIQLNASSNSHEAEFELSQLKCISSIQKTTTTQGESADSPPANIASSNAFSAHFNDDTFFKIENITDESDVSNSITLGLIKEQSENTTQYSNTCLEDSSCETLSTFQQSILETKGQLSTSVEYSSANNLNAEINISIAVK